MTKKFTSNRTLTFFSFLLLLLLGFNAYAQKETNIWYFGWNAGLDFNNTPPTALTNGVLATSEGCATICDKNGSLLFYTDGQQVWNRNHVRMANGNGLLGHPSATQSAVIVPKPGSTTRYYIFTTGNNAPNTPCTYSEVDMTLSGGLGDVVTATKNTILFSTSAEKVTAVKHANSLYTWIITQEMSGKYRSYLLDCNGVGSAVISNVGHARLADGLGYLVAYSDGTKLANAIWAVGHFVLDFDNATGIISNPLFLGLPATQAYGISFSPNGRFVYGSSLTGGNITQWDLQAGSTAAILASATVVGTGSGVGAYNYKGGALQIGPDGKIYMTQYNEAFLSVINNPDIAGLACNFQVNAVPLAGRTASLGLPGFVQKYTTQPVIDHSGSCLESPVSFSINNTNANSLDSVRWYFGDPLSGAQDSSDNVAPTHQFTSKGTFTVRLIKYLACVSDTTYTTISIRSVKVDLGPDTSSCLDTITLSSSVAYGSPSYLWSTGETGQSIKATQAVAYWLQVTDSGCVGVDTVLITSPILHLNLGNDTSICEKDTITLDPVLPAGTQYTWSTGATAPNIQVSTTGTYWLSATNNYCTGSDTIDVKVKPNPILSLGPDTTICDGLTIVIGTDIPGAIYEWSTGRTDAFINVNTAGSYALTVSVAGCKAKDTVDVALAPVPHIDLGPDQDICPGQTIVLDATYPDASYSWTTENTTATYAATAAGTYIVTVTSPYGCIGRDSIELIAYPLPIVRLGADTTICKDATALLTPFQLNSDSLLWSNGTVGNELLATQTGVYMVTAVNKCGTATDSVTVKKIFCDIWLPDAFTPNGDGLNDVFRILGDINKLQGVTLSIFNRWGQLLFHTADKTQGWNGKYNGEDQLLGTYTYMLLYSLDGSQMIQKGNFHLIR